jgi:predicted nuclease with TOPRIM domain
MNSKEIKGKFNSQVMENVRLLLQVQDLGSKIKRQEEEISLLRSENIMFIRRMKELIMLVDVIESKIQAFRTSRHEPEGEEGNNH